MRTKVRATNTTPHSHDWGKKSEILADVQMTAKMETTPDESQRAARPDGVSRDMDGKREVEHDDETADDACICARHQTEHTVTLHRCLRDSDREIPARQSSQLSFGGAVDRARAPVLQRNGNSGTRACATASAHT